MPATACPPESPTSSEMSAIHISNDSNMKIPKVVGNRPPKPSLLNTTCPLKNDKVLTVILQNQKIELLKEITILLKTNPYRQSQHMI